MMISLQDINLNFEGRQLLNNFNLTIGKGEKAVLKGPSGTGKSTILNIIMGFIRPDSGTIKINNVKLDSGSIRKIRSEIAWLPQNFNVFTGDTVEDAIYYPFSFEHNKKIKPGREKILEAFDKLSLDRSILKNSPDNISGGEKQRIGLIICRFLRKNIIILDEPTSALDAESKTRVIDYVLRDDDCTVLSASHDDEWSNNCTKIIGIGNGNK